MFIGRYYVRFARDGAEWKWRASGHGEMWSPPYETREAAERAARQELQEAKPDAR